MLEYIFLQERTNINLPVTTQILDDLIEKGIDLGERIIIAIVVYIIGRWLIRLIRKLTHRILYRKKVENVVTTFTNSLVNMILQVILILTIIGVLGIATTSFAALLAAVGLAVGMAMKDNLANFAGGVMILLNKPFKLNDYIVAQGQEGNVKEIGILYTILISGDGRTIYLPNGPLSTGSIVNNSVHNTRRVDITLNISYENNSEELKKTLTNIVETNPLVLNTPAPFIGITSINNNNFDITVRAWTFNSNYGTLSTQLNEKIHNELTNRGILTTSPLSIKMVTE